MAVLMLSIGRSALYFIISSKPEEFNHWAYRQHGDQD